MKTFEEVAQDWKLERKIGFVGDGWAYLVEKALQDLDSLGCTPSQIKRIKESSGRLRISILPTENTLEECNNVLSEAHYRSGIICELCGEYKEEVKIPTCLSCRTEGKVGENYEALQEKQKQDAQEKLNKNFLQ